MIERKEREAMMSAITSTAVGKLVLDGGPVLKALGVVSRSVIIKSSPAKVVTEVVEEALTKSGTQDGFSGFRDEKLFTALLFAEEMGYRVAFTPSFAATFKGAIEKMQALKHIHCYSSRYEVVQVLRGTEAEVDTKFAAIERSYPAAGYGTMVASKRQLPGGDFIVVVHRMASCD